MKISEFRPFLITMALCVPGGLIRFVHPELSPFIIVILTGFAIFGASFMLTWTCEAAEMDIPQAVAVAVVALIAVLPEYSVDMYFTWMAGQNPDSRHREHDRRQQASHRPRLVCPGLYFCRAFPQGY